MPTAEQITGPEAEHGEGPVWSGSWGGLRYVDIPTGDVLHLDPDTGAVSRWRVGTVAAALRPRRGGGAIIATQQEFVLADEMDGPVRLLARVFDETDIRFNDGSCDPAGNFLCGTMAYDERSGAGSLYRVDATGAVSAVLTGSTISNGLAWTADGSRAYYNDTPTHRVDVFDSDPAGNLTNRRPFAVIDEVEGFPDGLTVDAEGGVWVALWNGGAVRHYAADGSLVEVVEVSTPKVSACTFGGPNLDELYITTSRQGDAPGADPKAGALFRCSPGVRGLPAATFGG